MSNWEGRMSAKMSTYASNDALVGLVLFRGLIGTLELVGMFDLGYDSFFL